ncbi:MAG: hypothetical protein JW797_15915 [Bradymonadales bacterium]|nr:hypothetical protein [Bradymonadales bacterium]
MPLSGNISSAWPVHCTRHPAAPAIALCTRCGRFLCASCRSLDDASLAVCADCKPAVPKTSGPLEATAAPGRFRHLLRTAKLALLQPAALVESLDHSAKLAPPLQFGLLSIILGKLAYLAWFLLLEREVYLQAIAPLADQLDMSVKTFQILQLSLLPLDSLARLALFALLLRLGVRLAAGPGNYPYRDFVRLFAYACAGYLLLFLPFFLGMIASFLYILYLSYRIVKHRFALTSIQSLIALVPLGLALLLLEFLGGL